MEKEDAEALEALPNVFRRPKDCCRIHFTTVRKNPFIIFIPICLMLALCGAGVATIMTFQDAAEQEARAEAELIAIRSGEWFSDQLDQAILPLFSLSQFVHEIDLFEDLAGEIGPAFQPGSLPFLPGDPLTHRNVSTVCEQPDLVRKFNDISASLKANAGMEGVLVNLQLAPEAVVCLAYPLNNTEDFSDGIFMDNTGAIGHDLLTDPKRAFIARATIPSDKLVIAGPLTLRQCEDCHPTVEKAFIARLPITSETHTMQVDGESYFKWGFAVALINWNEVIVRSNINQDFEERGMEFRLTRTDHNVDVETGVITVAVSKCKSGTHACRYNNSSSLFHLCFSSKGRCSGRDGRLSRKGLVRFDRP
jgi:hypothetical protein